jgi:glycosyltransferase involved in cell wall biosynthesis
MKLSLCITNYNRLKLTIESFSKILQDPRIDEVVIVDDASEEKYWTGLYAYFHEEQKVRLVCNKNNLGMSRNKARAISLARNEWVIIFDSDNKIRPDYIDALEKVGKLDPDMIYMPEFSRPSFDFRKYAGLVITRRLPKIYLAAADFNCLMNDCNYVVHRDAYAEVYEHNPAMKGTDTAWMNYLWLKANKRFHIVQGMQYDHLVHPGSGWLADSDYNMARWNEIKQLMMEL